MQQYFQLFNKIVFHAIMLETQQDTLFQTTPIFRTNLQQY